LQLDDGVEDAAFQASFGELGEEALDGVDPGTGPEHAPRVTRCAS
jgi:hypothetical protein